MNKEREENVVYLADRKPRRKKRKLTPKMIGKFVVVGMIIFGCLAVARQEITLRKIKKQQDEVAKEYQELIVEEDLLKKELEEARSNSVVERKAKEILGWIKQGEVKVIEEKSE